MTRHRHYHIKSYKQNADFEPESQIDTHAGMMPS